MTARAARTRELWRRLRRRLAGWTSGSPPEPTWAFAAVLLCAATLAPLLVPQFERLTGTTQPVPMVGSRAAPAPRLIVVVVDGLGAGPAFTPGWMPKLQAHGDRGAVGVALASFPTVTPPGVRAIFTGRRISPRPGFPGAGKPDRELDSVFARAVAAGRRVFVFGQQDYAAMFEGHAPGMGVVPYHGPPANYDKSIIKLGLTVLRGERGRWDLLTLHLFDLDIVGHLYRADSARYREKLAEVDRAIDALAELAGPETAVVVTADHGQLEAGTHGGAELAVRQVPFVAWGRGVRPGRLKRFPQTEIAPTLSALLGIPAPALSEGLPVLEAVDLAPRERAAAMLDALEHRRRKWRAAKADWPWLRNDPAPRLLRAKAMWKAGDYPGTEAYARAAIREMDAAMAEFAPAKWFGKLLWTLYLLTLAALLAAPRRRTPAILARLARWAGGGCLIALAAPLLFSGLWPACSAIALTAAATTLAVSAAASAIGDKVSRASWVVPLAAAAGIAFPAVLDANLWSWLALLGVCAAWRRARGLFLGMLGLALALEWWLPLQPEMSLARSFLPNGALLRGWWNPPWWSVEAALLGLAAAAAYRRLRGWSPGKPRMEWLAYVLALLPLAASLLLPPADLTTLAWTCAICWISFSASWLLPAPAQVRTAWLSMILLGFLNTLSGVPAICLLIPAVLAGWGLGDARQERPAPWEGLTLLAFVLWAYTLPGGRLDFSHISVGEGYLGLGRDWHPQALIALIALKHVLALGLPILPYLARLTFHEAAEAIPFLGAFSAGSLSQLWLDRFYLGSPLASLMDERTYELSIWAALLGWILLGLWFAARLTFPTLAPGSEGKPIRARGSRRG